jgi:arylsulfatase A-like enzyme
MKHFFSILFCSLLAFACKDGNEKIASPENRPNILIINIDDLGWKDVSYSGNEFYETPNIDALSKMGMVFTNGYASASNCAPSRASLMTGQWTQRHGILTVGDSDRGKSRDRKLVPIANKTVLADNFLIVPSVFKDKGYRTCHAGKWHISEDPPGFDVNIGGSHAGHPSSYYAPFKNITLEAEEGTRLTDLIMDKTIEFIRGTNEPFFINYSPYAVHTPIQPVKALIKKYAGRKGKEGQSNVDFGTMIENLDQNIGRLVSTLQETGKLKNTFIVFTSDNGGLFAVSSQHPLRAGKGSYYEGGIRVPFFFVWKGKIKQEQQNDLPISNLDIFPTLLELAGISKPKDLQLDGQSLSPVLIENKPLKERPLFWHFPIYLQAIATDNENRDPKFRTRPGSVIRYGKWKLHHYFEDNGLELYDLENDLGEQHNLAESEPEKTRELLELLNAWRIRTKAPVPTELNPEYVGNTLSMNVQNPN